MRLGSLASARSAYYDRNATGTFLQYGGTVAPHTATTRFSSTIASGKKAYIEVCQAYAYRSVAAGVGNNSVVWFRVLNSGATTYASTIFTRSDTAATGLMIERVVTGQVTIYAGEALEALTIDGSTGGSIDFNLSAKLTNFDA